MFSIPTAKPSSLMVQPIAHSTAAGRWRTEAMRSHGTPRLLVFSKGHGRITIAGLTKGFGPNNLIFIPARTMYGFETNATVFGQVITIPEAMAKEWPDYVVHLRLRDVAAQKEFVGLMDGLEKELSTEPMQHNRAAYYRLGLLSVFFERQLDASESTDPLSETSSARLVAAFTDLVDRGFRSDEGIADYAAKLGVTSTHLTRCCKQTCGRSALELLTDRRHYEACMMLRETQLPIQIIAVDLGFSSPAYFSRAFQLRTGQSPSAFRKNGETTTKQAAVT